MRNDTGFDDIRAVVIDYLEGMIYGDAGQLCRAFHPNALAAGHYQGQFFATTREDFIPEWLAAGSIPRGTPFDAEITMIDVTGDIAVVKVTDTCFDNDFTDYLTLSKFEGGWQIVAKAWFVHPMIG